MYDLARIKVILNDLESGARKASDLTGDEFQYVVLQRLISKFKKEDDQNNYSLIDAHQGEVDFIVRVQPKKRSLLDHPDGDLYMFECKNYGRNIELDTVAKAFLVGIRRKPALLAVVARTPLQPQAVEFARAIFPEYRQTIQNTLVTAPVFRFFKTDELVGIDFSTGTLPPGKATTPSDTDCPIGLATIHDWCFYEYRPFEEAMLAQHEETAHAVELAAGRSYRLDLVITSSCTYVEADTIIDGLPQGTTTVIKVKELATHFSNLKEIAISVILKLAPRVTQGAYKPTIYLAQASRTSSALLLPLNISLGQSFPRLPELRQEQLDEFGKEFRMVDASRIVFLGGPAGVGKTHFCEQMAIILRSRHRYDIHRFTLDGRQSTILWSILTTVMTPPAARSNRTNLGTPWVDLAALLVERGNTGTVSDGKAVPSPELIMPILARFLSVTGDRLLIFRDAHLMSEAAANQLSSLIYTLEDIGLNSVRFLFEHRTCDRTESPAWERFSKELSGRSDNITSINLTPLSLSELSNSLDIIFDVITEDVKRKIFSITYGFPLDMENLFSVLRRSRAIAPTPAGQLTILKPSEFDNPDLTSERGHAILLERISRITWPAPYVNSSKLNIPCRLFLGLVAVASSSNRIQMLCSILGILPSEFKIFTRTLEEEDLIFSPLYPYEIAFKHALLQADCVSLIDNLPKATFFIEELLGRLEAEKLGVLEQELCSDLAAAAGLKGEALHLILPVAESWRRRDNFDGQCRVFGKLCERIAAIEPLSEADLHRLMEARNALGWAMWNAGSQLEAVDLFELVKQESLKIPDDTHRREFNSGNALRRIVGLELELEQFQQMIPVAKEGLRSRLDWLHYNSIMNRLVLASSRLCFPNLAHRFAQILIEAFGYVDNIESPGAVICSDIGGIYRAIRPDLSLRFYEDALNLTRDLRQDLYSRMELAITEALLNQTDAAEQQLQALRGEMVAAGLTEMLTRMDLVQGGLAVSSGRVASGRIMIDRAVTSISVYRRMTLQIPALNDSMIAALAQEDMRMAKRRAGALLVALREKIAGRLPMFRELSSLVEDAENARHKFWSALPSLELSLPDYIPFYSGMWLQALMNLAQVADILLPKEAQAEVKSLWPNDLDRETCKKLSIEASALSVQCVGLRLALCVH